MRKTNKKIVAFILTLALVFSFCGTVFANANTMYRPTDVYEDVEHGNVDFADIAYQRYDVDDMRAVTKKMAKLISEKGNEKDVLAQYYLIVRQANKANSMYVLADLNTELDTKSTYWQKEKTAMHEIMIVTYKIAMTSLSETMKSDYAEIFEDELGLEAVYYYYSYVPSSDVEDKLQVDFNDLQTQYLNLYNSADEDVFVSKAGELFLKIVENRNKLARHYDFDNYADLAYYIKNISPEEVDILRTGVKEYIAPIVSELVNSFSQEDLKQLKKLQNTKFTQQQVIDVLGAHIDDVSSEMKEAYDYMIKYNLYNIDSSESKNDVGFTTEFTMYNSPFLFNKGDGTNYDITALIHEFGHFNAFYHDDTNYLLDNSSLDVAEVASQGLEMLFYSFYDEIYGENCKLIEKNDIVNSIVGAVLNGCLMDEFQYTVYTSDKQYTVDDLNNLYNELLDEYQLKNYYSEGTWAYVQHTFVSPFYYISYATSALSSYDIWQLSKSNFNKAADTYLEVTKLVQEGDFIKAMQQAGIGDIFDKKIIRNISVVLSNYFLGQSYSVGNFRDVQYTDWFADAVEYVTQNGIMGGTGDGIFEPKTAMTRAMLVTVLARAEKVNTANYTNTFSDVQNGSWHEKSVAWAAKNNVVNGSGDGTFAPNSSVTREQLCAMLIRYAINKGFVNKDITVDPQFNDSSSISDWAKNFVGIAQQIGLVNGKQGNNFDPKGTATRAEISAIMQRFYNMFLVEHTTRTSPIDCSTRQFENSNRDGGAEGWSWNYATKTLYLTNVTIECQDDIAMYVPDGTTIVLIGENKINSKNGIIFNGNVSIVGTGTLEIVSDFGINEYVESKADSYGILSIDGITLDIKAKHYGISGCKVQILNSICNIDSTKSISIASLNDSEIKNTQLNLNAKTYGIMCCGNLLFENVYKSNIFGEKVGIQVEGEMLRFVKCDITVKGKNIAAVLLLNKTIDPQIVLERSYFENPEKAIVVKLSETLLAEKMNAVSVCNDISGKVKIITSINQLSNEVVIKPL